MAKINLSKLYEDMEESRMDRLSNASKVILATPARKAEKKPETSKTRARPHAVRPATHVGR